MLLREFKMSNSMASVNACIIGNGNSLETLAFMSLSYLASNGFSISCRAGCTTGYL
jgi:hypothetical protein